MRLLLVKELGELYIYAPSLTVSVLEYMNSPSAASKDDFCSLYDKMSSI